MARNQANMGGEKINFGIDFGWEPSVGFGIDFGVDFGGGMFGEDTTGLGGTGFSDVEAALTGAIDSDPYAIGQNLGLMGDGSSLSDIDDSPGGL